MKVATVNKRVQGLGGVSTGRMTDGHSRELAKDITGLFVQGRRVQVGVARRGGRRGRQIEIFEDYLDKYIVEGVAEQTEGIARNKEEVERRVKASREPVSYQYPHHREIFQEGRVQKLGATKLGEESKKGIKRGCFSAASHLQTTANLKSMGVPRGPRGRKLRTGKRGSWKW